MDESEKNLKELERLRTRIGRINALSKNSRIAAADLTDALYAVLEMDKNDPEREASLKDILKLAMNVRIYVTDLAAEAEIHV